MLGIPVRLVLGALLLSTLLGIVLSSALEAATSGTGRSSSGADPGSVSGNNAGGLPVVTETTLGSEVQILFEDGTLQPTTSFDAVACLREQGEDDVVIIFEEVAWGPDQTPSWLMVHSPQASADLGDAGGIVETSVVRPGCGSDPDADPESNLLWSGSVLIGE